MSREKEYKDLMVHLSNQIRMGLAGANMNWDRFLNIAILAHQYDQYLKSVKTEDIEKAT